MDNILVSNNQSSLSESDLEDILSDLEFKEIDHVLFTTPSGRKVVFVKVDAIYQKINKELGYQWRRDRYSDGYKAGILHVWKLIDNICEGSTRGVSEWQKD